MQCNATQRKRSVRHLMTARSWLRSVRHRTVRYTYRRIFTWCYRWACQSNALAHTYMLLSNKHGTLPHLATPQCISSTVIGGNKHHQRLLQGLHTVLSDTWKTTWCCRWACQSSARTHTHKHTLLTHHNSAMQRKLSVRHLMTAGSWSRSVRHLMTALRYTYRRIFIASQMRAHARTHKQ